MFTRDAPRTFSDAAKSLSHCSARRGMLFTVSLREKTWREVGNKSRVVNSSSSLLFSLFIILILKQGKMSRVREYNMLWLFQSLYCLWLCLSHASRPQSLARYDLCRAHPSTQIYHIPSHFKNVRCSVLPLPKTTTDLSFSFLCPFCPFTKTKTTTKTTMSQDEYMNFSLDDDIASWDQLVNDVWVLGGTTDTTTTATDVATTATVPAATKRPASVAFGEDDNGADWPALPAGYGPACPPLRESGRELVPEYNDQTVDSAWEGPQDRPAWTVSPPPAPAAVAAPVLPSPPSLPPQAEAQSQAQPRRERRQRGAAAAAAPRAVAKPEEQLSVKSIFCLVCSTLSVLRFHFYPKARKIKGD